MVSIEDLSAALGIAEDDRLGGDHRVRSPIDGAEIGRIRFADEPQIDRALKRAEAAFRAWRLVPPPRRGELIRLFGQELRDHKEPLGLLVTIETGKILSEGRGEVQEMIDMCDFAQGLSRQLYGRTIPSERPGHRISETWHPLGVVGVITAFNFPVAVWAWNFTLAIVCGDPVVWKPSEKTPLTARACEALFARALGRFEHGAPDGLLAVLPGGRDIGQALARDRRVALVSATGSTAMGRAVAPAVAQRFGRALLELGGNNGMIVTPSADFDLTVPAILFAAAGTAGQRCTTLRRLIVHEGVADPLIDRLKASFEGLAIGDPRETETLVGPLIDGAAWEGMERALDEARTAGGRVTGGERVLADRWPGAFYVRPAIVEMPAMADVVRRETFAPILYVLRYRDWDHAIDLHNDVPQGLASSLFTGDLTEAERFLAADGSDCGIVNVNVGPSGAEIGGAFGGEKDTGGGREAGSDAWKAYMRQATATINASGRLPLAQEVVFGDAG
jgi:aldehyde dehydrogenase (NAD+)